MLAIVDLPDPDSPTNATFSPALINRLKFLKMDSYLAGYLNYTFYNLIFPSVTT